MRIAIVTNIRSPYRKLQIEEFSKLKNVSLKVYYTDKNFVGRKWMVDKINGVEECFLRGIELSPKYGYINLGLFKIVKQNDMVVLGGYEKPTYILLSVICKFFNKPYCILFDGISPKLVYSRENIFKFKLKDFVIRNSSALFANGKVSLSYFTKKFNCSSDQIFNQYLTVDINTILRIAANKSVLKREIREKYNIKNDKKVIIYSGRLVKRKNVDLVVQAISQLQNKKDYVLFILGDGEEKKNIINLAKLNNVQCICTGFIEKQEELFKHYFAGDLLILPSFNEPWGLVVNEAMAAGLPVIVSNECGASSDLVKNDINGYIMNEYTPEEVSCLIDKIINSKENMGKNSVDIISKWTFKQSKKNFDRMIKHVLSYKF